MKVFIAGIDGYLGWALAQSLLQRGHEVAGADNMARRSWVEEVVVLERSANSSNSRANQDGWKDLWA